MGPYSVNAFWFIPDAFLSASHVTFMHWHMDLAAHGKVRC